MPAPGYRIAPVVAGAGDSTVTPPAATSEAVASGGTPAAKTFGAFTDADGVISSYSATINNTVGTTAIAAGSGLGAYSFSGHADLDSFVLYLDAKDASGAILSTAIHGVGIAGTGSEAQSPAGASGTAVNQEVLRHWVFTSWDGSTLDFRANGAGTEVIDGSVIELVGGHDLTIITADTDDTSTWQLASDGLGMSYVVTSGFPRFDWDAKLHLDDVDVAEVVYVWDIVSVGTGDGFRLDTMSNTTGAFTAGDILREVNYSGTVWRDRMGYWTGSAHTSSAYVTVKTGTPTAARIGTVYADSAVMGRSDADANGTPDRMSLTQRNFNRAVGVLASTSATRLWSGNMWNRVIVIYGAGITCRLREIIVIGGV